MEQYEIVNPYDKWNLQAAIDKKNMEEGKMPNPYHWPTEILTIEECIEKYGYALTEEQIQILKDQINGK